jgi:hypothetical protein
MQVAVGFGNCAETGDLFTLFLNRFELAGTEFKATVCKACGKIILSIGLEPTGCRTTYNLITFSDRIELWNCDKR